MAQAMIVSFDKGIECLADEILESPKPFLASVSGPIPALTGSFIRELESELRKFELRGEISDIRTPPKKCPVMSYFIVKADAKLELPEADEYFMAHFNKKAARHVYVNEDESIAILQH